MINFAQLVPPVPPSYVGVIMNTTTIMLDTDVTVAETSPVPIFIYRNERDRFGDGIFCMTACFINTGIHVDFVLEVEDKSQTILEVKNAGPCNGTCNGRVGKKYAFGTNKKTMPRYSFSEIITEVEIYKKKLGAQTQKSKASSVSPQLSFTL